MLPQTERGKLLTVSASCIVPSSSPHQGCLRHGRAATDCEGFCLRSSAHLQEGHAACLPSQMPETPSMGSMLCLRWGREGHCQGVVPGLCVLELPVMQAAQPHVRVLKTWIANSLQAALAAAQAAFVSLQVCVGTSAADVPLTACIHQQQHLYLPPSV